MRPQGLAPAPPKDKDAREAWAEIAMLEDTRATDVSRLLGFYQSSPDSTVRWRVCRAFARLHTQFITPFDRSEIHRLLSRIDDVLDLADAAAERLSLYDIDSVLPEARELCGVLVVQTEKMAQAVHGLREMKKDPNAILDACKEMNVLENQADTLTRRTMAKLFKRGNDPLTVMKWKEIIDLIEDATDRAEDVANVIEGVVLEHA